MSERLSPRAGEAIRRDRPVSFRFERTTVEAFEGDTIGSALAAAGVGITSRSFKYHRPRGLYCMTGSCPNCLMQVDGIPNVRTCTEPVRDGMRVQRMNAQPTADRDIWAIADKASFMLVPGFYYKVFHRPRWAWPLVEPLIRSRAGLGRVPDEEDHRTRERVNLHCDVLVIGAGAGARTVVLEQTAEAGGHLHGARDVGVREDLARQAREAGATILEATAALGVFDGPLVAAAGRDALYRIRARHLVFATGAIEQGAVFPNNDLPGVMLSGAVELLVHRFGVRPGRRAVVLTSGDAGYATAGTLGDAGVATTVVDLRPEGAVAEGSEVLAGSTILAARGRRRVRSVTVGPVDGGPAGPRSIPCDLVVLAGFEAPSTNLLAMSGARVGFDAVSQAFLPTELPQGVHAVGAVAGARTSEMATAQGRLAGLEAAASLGRRVDASTIERLRGEAARSGDPVVLPPEVGSGSGKQLACVCMDVTHKEITTAVAEGFDSMELLKRYTTITMGPCQGKACMLASQRLCGRATGRSLEETPPTTARAPWIPTELGTLAGDRLTPRKETTMHDAHADEGAAFMWAGDWRRPHHYTTPEEEVEGVRYRVGAIDVSSLGKFRIAGPGAADLLERLYPNRFSDLAVGRIRYGLMLNDEGVILDDGTVARLGDEEFFVTVTTGNTAALERWMTWWQADWGFDARILNVTGAYGAINLAGPQARDVMRRLTPADVSAEALRYLSAERMEVAGVGAIVLRIGFVGELGYEIHFPSMYGEHVWGAVMEAGRPLMLRPFGLEAQRVLRLEKQHILIGQDTDAESDPYEVGLGWAVKADKPDFLGKRALRDLERAGPGERLVGFTMSNGWLPPEGASVVHEGVWVGRVTSARRSEAIGAVVGLAWVPAGWAHDGTGFEVQFGKQRGAARVALGPFYDPEGGRLRS